MVARRSTAASSVRNEEPICYCRAVVAPLVTVITRTRNRPLFLQRALASVRAQTFGEWAHLVVNDGGARAALDALPRDERLDVLHLPGVGRGSAANEGLARAKTTLVVFHDDDDTWHPNFLARAVEAWRRTGRKGVVTRTERVIERLEGDRVIEVRREPFFPDLSAVSISELARENCFTNLAFLIERAAAVEVGGYDVTLPLYEDWDFNLRFLSRFDVSVVPEVLACYHHRESAAGEARNSFLQDAAHAADARAVLLNRWLRDPDRRHVGTLMALGPALGAIDGMRERVDKLFNLLHGARQSWPLRTVEGWLKRR
jgi:glycosyltransferase involved in cell wall biosynthesis